MKDDLYAILGIAREASLAEIKKAYRKASKLKHPDAGGSPEEFKRINEAYEVLVDPAKRKLYDETGETNNEAIEEMTRQLAIGAFDRDVDPAIWMREQLTGAIHGHERDMKDGIRRRDQMRSRLDRFRKYNTEPGEALSIVIETIESRIADMERMIEQAESCILLNKACQQYISTLKERPIDHSGFHPFGSKNYNDLMVGFKSRNGLSTTS